MTKQFAALALIAAFGLAHATDAPPAAAEVQHAVVAPEAAKTETKAKEAKLTESKAGTRHTAKTHKAHKKSHKKAEKPAA